MPAPDEPTTSADSTRTTTSAGEEPGAARGRGAAGYEPGTILAGRYRITGLIGRGGMGEVYRADDLKLGQPVALKFLPAILANNAARQARFYAEVRMARQVSHPNVCRVYDVAEADGRQFLSMEYIDGEDLASLVRRMGRLPGPRVLDIAQQLCAGLAAAHDRGVLHRDLKPANILLDGRGRVHIADFGLAVAIDHADEDRRLAGTPPYMAPEQLDGRGASAQSDVYALGLVLYELCTGRRAFTARTMAELREQKAQPPPPAADIDPDLDPDLERVIRRCLERDPRARPASVAEVAAALPERDPLAAALAAGETPSPEMVAASSGAHRLPPTAAWAWLALLGIGTAGTVWLGSRAIVTRLSPLERPPDALVERARQMLDRAGLAAPRNSTFGIAYDTGYLQDRHARDPFGQRPADLSPDAVVFWYRQSPRPLRRLSFSIGMSPQVTPEDPPLAGSGEAIVRLNGAGRLVGLTIVPEQISGPPQARDYADWAALFHDAGLDFREWTAEASLWTPQVFADRRLAWRPIGPAPADGATRVEAASLLGRPVHFQVVRRWDPPGPTAGSPAPAPARVANLVGYGLTAIGMVGGVLFARRNLRLGRGDRRGAWRLAIFVTAMLAGSWILDENHVADAHEWYLFVSFLGRALVLGSLCWVMYMAFEPYVRRHMPWAIVSWSRLIAGDVRNPLVGRDLLIGCAAGALLTCLLLAGHLASSWLGRPAEMLVDPTWRAWYGPRQAVSLVLLLVCNALLEAFTALFLLFMLRQALRHPIAAAAVCAVLMATPDILLSNDRLVSGAFYLGVFALGVLVLVRFGLLAVIALRFCVDLLQAFPIVPDLSAWYAPIGVSALALLALIAAWSVTAALRGRSAAARRPGYG